MMRVCTWESRRTKSNIVQQLSTHFYSDGNSLDMYTYFMIFFGKIPVSYQITRLLYPVPNIQWPQVDTPDT